jgi:polyketide cyclase/dehydrase/lipid transport protein
MPPGNDVITQEVVGRNEIERSLTYRTVGQALSLHDYVGTYRVLPVTNERGTSFMEWSREFRIVEGADPGFLPMIMQMIAQETDTVQAYFAR